MGRLIDYLRDVYGRGFADQEVERLLSGSTPVDQRHTRLVDFIDALQDYRPPAPQTAVALVADLAAIAGEKTNAGVDRERDANRPDRRNLFKPHQLAWAAGAMMVMAVPGVALSADGALPGSFLYPIDRALERIGIGVTPGEERVEEALRLIDTGKPAEGIAHLVGSLVEAKAQGDQVAAAKIMNWLTEAETMVPGAVLEMVDEKKSFIEDNKGDGIGLDGKLFGQGVSEIARDVVNPDTGNPPSGSEGANGITGPPDHAQNGGTDGSTGPPEHAQNSNAGSKEDRPGRGNPPDNAGPTG